MACLLFDKASSVFLALAVTDRQMDARKFLRALVWSMVACVALGHDLYEEFGEDRPSTDGMYLVISHESMSY